MGVWPSWWFVLDWGGGGRGRLGCPEMGFYPPADREWKFHQGCPRSLMLLGPSEHWNCTASEPTVLLLRRLLGIAPSEASSLAAAGLGGLTLKTNVCVVPFPPPPSVVGGEHRLSRASDAPPPQSRRKPTQPHTDSEAMALC